MFTGVVDFGITGMGQVAQICHFLVCHRFWASGWTPVPNAFEKTMWGVEPLTRNKCECHVYYCPEIPLQCDAEWKDRMVMKAAPSS